MVETRDTRYGADNPTFADALRRVQAEYLEMPGLQLTRTQAARLWALDTDLCDAVLAALIEARFLICSRGAFFVRAR